jgi:hypothetical protein
MRKADAVELLDTRTFITTRDFGGELFHSYQLGDREDVNYENIEAEIQGDLLTLRITGRHRSDPEAEPWVHDYTYCGRFLVHWTDT